MLKIFKLIDMYYLIGVFFDLLDVLYSIRLILCYLVFLFLKLIIFLLKVYFFSFFLVDVGVYWSYEMFYFWKVLKDGVNEIFFV